MIYVKIGNSIHAERESGTVPIDRWTVDVRGSVKPYISQQIMGIDHSPVNNTIREDDMDYDERCAGLIVSIPADVQVTGSKSRAFLLIVDYSQMTVREIAQRCAKDVRILWQNTHRAKGEEHMSGLSPKQNIVAQPVGARGAVDIEAAYMTRAETLPLGDLENDIAKMEAILAARKAKIGPKPGHEAKK